jgi:hypothetical protein
MSIESPTIPPYNTNDNVDALGARPILLDLPYYNNADNVRMIMRGVLKLVPQGPVSELPHIYEPGVALGAIADTDMAISSARRFIEDPVGETPGLEPTLVELADIATEVDGAPKDTYRATLDTYTQPRLLAYHGLLDHAMFTRLGSERTFVSETGLSFDAMRRAAAVMTSADLFNEPTEELVARLDFAAEQATTMFNSTLRAMSAYRNEKAGPFASVHRPYFDPYVVNGKLLDAASAAQSPTKEVEFVLRGVGTNIAEGGEAESFGRFYMHNLPYTPAARQKEVEDYVSRNGALSMFSYITLLDPGERRDQLGAAYVRAMKALTAFSKAHNGGVERDFRQRAEGAKGGGGFDNKDLRNLMVERRNHLVLAQELFGQAA